MMLRNIPILSFESANAFEEWLAEHHDVSEGIWLRFFKKSSGVTAVTHPEALDEALCYGWIDGQLKKHDEVSWLHKFTPRRPRSVWSKRNTEHIERLTTAGRMRPAGLRQVEAAKADGRWDKAYEPASKMTMPEDFMSELAKSKKAQASFDTLNKSNRNLIAWQLQSAVKPETRLRRMRKYLNMLEDGKKPAG